MPIYYPVNLDLTGRLCVILGDPRVVERKSETVLECGARIRAVTPNPTPRLRERASAGEIELRQRDFQPGDVSDAWLVIASTGDRATDEAIHREAVAAKAVVNIVDVPDLCTFITPAVVRRGPLTIAVNTNGVVPGFSKRVRQRLESLYGPEYEPYLALMAEAREQIKEKFGRERTPQAIARREAVGNCILDSEALSLMLEGDEDGARGFIKRCLECEGVACGRVAATPAGAGS